MKTFKKIILILLILVLVVGIVACDDPTNPDGPPGGSGSGSGNGSGSGSGSGSGNSESGSGSGSGDSGSNTPGAHVHSFSYTRDGNYHKKVCTCGASYEAEEHEWSDNYVQSCAIYKRCTVCGYQKTIQAETHSYKYVAEYLRDAKNKVTGFNTLEKCSTCGKVNHSHYGLPDIPVNVANVGFPFDPDTGIQHFAVKLSMTRDAEYGNRLLYRHMTKTFVVPYIDADDPYVVKGITDTIVNEDNYERTVQRLEYMSDILPYDVYTADYAFDSMYLKTPFEIFDFATEHVDSFYNRFFNFIRFMSTCTDEDKEGVLLSFEFDTSFIYQANGLVVRAKVTVDDPGDTTAKTIEELCSTPPNEGDANSYCDVFGINLNSKFQMKYLTDEDASDTLKAGDYVYCDIAIGIPKNEMIDEDVWESLLAKDAFGIAFGMYKF